MKNKLIILGIIFLLISVFCCRPISHHNQALTLKSLIQKGDVDGVSKMITANPWLLAVPLETERRWDIKALSLAVANDQEAIASNLLVFGANANEYDSRHFTPLHYAAMIDNTNMVVLLLNHGASITNKNLSGETPLDYAYLRGATNSIIYLLSTNISRVTN
jgi:Ankyrin repeats (3 copies)